MNALTEAAVYSALKRTSGNLTRSARLLGVTRDEIVAYAAARPLLRELLDDIREAAVDDAEAGLRAAVAQRQPWAIEFVLETLGHPRGYGEREQPIDETDQIPPPPEPEPAATLVRFLQACERERCSRKPVAGIGFQAEGLEETSPGQAQRRPG